MMENGLLLTVAEAEEVGTPNGIPAAAAAAAAATAAAVVGMAVGLAPAPSAGGLRGTRYLLLLWPYDNEAKADEAEVAEPFMSPYLWCRCETGDIAVDSDRSLPFPALRRSSLLPPPPPP